MFPEEGGILSLCSKEQTPGKPCISSKRGFHLCSLLQPGTEHRARQSAQRGKSPRAVPTTSLLLKPHWASLSQLPFSSFIKQILLGRLCFILSCQIMVDLHPLLSPTTANTLNSSTSSASSAWGWVTMHLQRLVFPNKKLCCAFRAAEAVMKGKPLSFSSICYSCTWCLMVFSSEMFQTLQFLNWSRPVILSRKAPWKLKYPLLAIRQS